jgi:hypothetical protein
MNRYLLPLLCLQATDDLQANGGGYSKGVISTTAFQPIGVDQVEMLSEFLEIDLHIEYADIRIEYVLHNPGKKVTVECGFPAVTSNFPMFVTLEQLAAQKPEMLEDFSLTADNAPVKVSVLADNARLSGGMKREQPRSIVSWHVVKIPFAAGQTRKISVRYRNPYYRQESTVSESSTSIAPSLTYAFSAAGLWAGPIKQGTVIIHAKTVNPDRVKLSHPKRFTREKGTWKWSFTDFEPTLEDDLIIETRPTRNGFDGTYLADGGEWSESGLQGAKWAFVAGFTATASSYLKESDGTEYPPENLNAWNASWVEGVEGDGIGESITLSLKKPANVTQVGLRNGFAKSRELYFANNRPAQFKVSVNGADPFKIDVPDEFLETERFWFDLPKSSALVKTIRFEISAVYSGTQYQDTAISAIDLLVPLGKAPKLEPVR